MILKLLRIMGIALGLMTFLAVVGLVGIYLISAFIIPSIGLTATLVVMLVLLFVILCFKISLEIQWGKRNG